MRAGRGRPRGDRPARVSTLCRAWSRVRSTSRNTPCRSGCISSLPFRVPWEPPFKCILASHERDASRRVRLSCGRPWGPGARPISRLRSGRRWSGGQRDISRFVTLPRRPREPVLDVLLTDATEVRGVSRRKRTAEAARICIATPAASRALSRRTHQPTCSPAWRQHRSDED